MRVTQGMMMRQYNSNLNKILSNLNNAEMKVMTRRKFLTGAENPSESVKSGQFRRQYSKNENYLANAESVKDKLETVSSSVLMFSKSATDASVLTNGISSKSLDERKIVAGELRIIQETMIKEANARFGDQFVFGGGSTKEVPFALEADGTVTFRGIAVNSTDPADQAKLKAMADEKIFVDLGFGLKVDTDPATGKILIDEGTAFNASTPGIKYLGFGQDADGKSNNVIEIIGEMARMLEQPTVDDNAFMDLSKRLDIQRNNILVGVTTLGTNSKFIDYTVTRLTNAEDVLNNKLANTELIPLEKAITDFQMQDATYRAALKMGSNILSVSFMDFMK